jgi:hypothetical protein
MSSLGTPDLITLVSSPEPSPQPLIERITRSELGLGSRSWTINHANHRHYHSVVRLAEAPLHIELMEGRVGAP